MSQKNFCNFSTLFAPFFALSDNLLYLGLFGKKKNRKSPFFYWIGKEIIEQKLVLQVNTWHDISQLLLEHSTNYMACILKGYFSPYPARHKGFWVDRPEDIAIVEKFLREKK